MSRRVQSFGCLVAALALCWTPPPVAADEPPRVRPGDLNVLVIVADDLNLDLPSYGNTMVLTPNIDRLAARALRFDRAYTQYPLCNPSRVSLLSGRRPETAGVLDNRTRPRATLGNISFLPEYFHQHGYFTARVGKMVGRRPDEVEIAWDVAEDGPPDHPVGWDSPIQYDPPDRLSSQPFWKAIDTPEADETDARNAVRAAQIIEQNHTRPFFIVAGFHRPHLPFVAPRSYFDLYPPDAITVRDPPPGDWDDIPPLALSTNSREDTPWDPALKQQAIAAYYASVSFIDTQVGVILDTLDRLGIANETIVVLMSDHGLMLGEHYLWRKDPLFEEGVATPLIIAAPGRAAGTATLGLVELVDLYPTLAELAGLPPPSGQQGRSLAPLLDEPTRPWSQGAWTVVEPAGFTGPGLGRTVRSARYRYTEWPDGTAELYDHDLDPKEYTNQVSNPEYAEARLQLQALLLSEHVPRLPPTAIDITGTTVTAGSPADTVVGILSTEDADSNVHTYSLVEDGAGRFRISGAELRVAPGAVLAAPTAIPVVLRSTDPDGFSVERQLSVVVLDGGIDHTPAAEPQEVAVVEDTPTAITLTGRPAEGGDLGLTFRVVRQPRHGTLSGTPPELTYTPDPDFPFSGSGADDFLFVAGDGAVEGASARVGIVVQAVEEPVVARDDGYATEADVRLTVPAYGVLSNDTDADAAQLTATTLTPPAHGILRLEPAGGFTYIPTAFYSGPDAFTYVVSDGASSASATATVDVIPAEGLRIDAISPLCGDPGTYVEILGTAFLPPVSVTFAGTPSPAQLLNSRVIATSVPAGAADGLLEVVVSGQTLIAGTFEASRGTLSITDGTIVEGDSGTSAATLTVSLSKPMCGKVNVLWSTAPGSAGKVDFVTASGNVVLYVGETSKTLTVAAVGDVNGEGDETFVVDIGAVNVLNGDGRADVHIVDDDPLPQLWVDDLVVSEGSPALFTISLLQPSVQTVRVSFATVAGSAGSGDYVTRSGTVSFAPGQTSKTVEVVIVSDVTDEPDEAFELVLSGATSASIARDRATGNIVDDDSQPAIALADVTVTEGDSGRANADFTITLAGASTQPVSVAYATVPGTAVAGDYRAQTGTVTLDPGATSRVVSIAVWGDLADEPDEEFGLLLSDPVNATIADDRGSGTILDDDGAPTMTIADLTTVEGDSGNKPAPLSVTLSAASGRTVTVGWQATAGTAVPGSDFVASSGTLTFTPGQTTRTLSVATYGDRAYELDEFFGVALGTAVNAVIADGTGTVTLTNDDAMPVLTIADDAVIEGDTGRVNADFTVTLTPASGLAATVQWAAAPATASAGSDYRVGSGSLSFAPGQTKQVLTVVVWGDRLHEGDEAFVVTLTSPVGGILGDADALGLITDDDAAPLLLVDDLSLGEGDSGQSTAVLGLRLSTASGVAVSVGYTSADATATGGTDYTAVSGTVTIAAGQTSATLGVPVIGDAVDEADEALVVLLSGAAGATLDRDSASVTIVDDDPLPMVSVAPLAVAEGDEGVASASLAATLSRASAHVVSFDWIAADGSAAGGADYEPASGTLTFAPGSTAAALVVGIRGDTLDEPDETILVQLSSPLNAEVPSAPGELTVSDDDAAPTVSAADVTVAEEGSADVVLTLSAASGRTVSVAWATVAGSAGSVEDFVAAEGTAVLAPGQTSATLTTAIAADLLHEQDETFSVVLSAPENSTLARDTATVTIVDDDLPPVVGWGGLPLLAGEADTAVVFDVRLSAPSGLPVSVAYATTDGTATAAADYETLVGTLTIAAGETAASLMVPLLDDQTDEDDETFGVTLSEPVGASLDASTRTATLTDDDAAPVVTVAGATVIEGDDAVVPLELAVTLSAPSAREVTLDWSTGSGSATPGIDYDSASGSLTFTPGATGGAIVVGVRGDVRDEDDETLAITLGNVVNASPADAAPVTIADDDAAPVLSADDITIAEGGSGAVALSLGAESALPVTVSWTLEAGSATSGADFEAASGTLTLLPGETAAIIPVSGVEDGLDEDDETLAVVLAATHATAARDRVTVTLADDDDMPTLALEPLPGAVSESDGAVAFTLRLGAPSGRPVTVAYASADVTASAGADYAATAGTLTIAPGETAATVDVPLLADALDEDDETFELELADPSGATLLVARASATIADDDAGPQLTVDDASATEGEGAVLSFAVTLSGPSGMAVTVDWASADATASAGPDYVAASGTLTFPAGETQQSVVVAVSDDAAAEDEETLALELSSPVRATIARTRGVGTIVDDDPLPSVTLARRSAAEGDDQTHAVPVQASLSTGSGRVVTVTWATADGSATAGDDYDASSGTLTFAPGETSAAFEIAVRGDSLDEDAETVDVLLASDGRAQVQAAELAVLTIDDDDVPPVVSILDATLTEGDAGERPGEVPLQLSAASALPVSVSWQTVEVGAVAGLDYRDASGVLTFAPGESQRTVPLTVLGDLLNERTERVRLALAGAVNGTVASPWRDVFIADDDPMPTLSVADATVVEGSGGVRNATFTVTLSAPSGRAVKVAFATSPGTAASPADFEARSGMLSLLEGQTVKTVAVPITTDRTYEGNEAFAMTLSAPQNAGIARALATGSIVEDDLPPTLSVADVTVAESGGAALFPITLSAASALPVSFRCATSPRSANGDDYGARSVVITMAPGQTSTACTVPIVADTRIEPSESFVVNLTAPSGATFARAQGTCTILDDDGP